MKSASEKAKKRRHSLVMYVALLAVAAGSIAFVLFVHPFLAVTQKVDADILIVEGWVPDYMIPSAVQEFRTGHYLLLAISGLENDPGLPRTAELSDAQKHKARLERLGIAPNAIALCPAPFARWLRTSKTAQAVQHKIAELGLKPKGINVLTAGPHARETWVAYQHIFGPEVPVGIISVPKNNYPAD